MPYYLTKDMDYKKRFSPKNINTEVKSSIFLEQKISVVIMMLGVLLAAISVIISLPIEDVEADTSALTRGFFIPAYFDIDQSKTDEINQKFDLAIVGSTSNYTGIDSEKILLMAGQAPLEANSWGNQDEWSEVNSHEDWFLHDPNTGARLFNPGYPHLYYMDLDSDGWTSYVISKYQERVQNHPSIDGVFVDEIYESLAYVSLLGPGKAEPGYTAEQYQQLITNITSEIKQTVGASRLVILNSDLFKPFTTDMDGGLDEGFVHFGGWENSRHATLSQWLNDVNQILDVDFNGKYILVGSGSLEETLPEMVEYCYASFLIGYNTNSHAYFYWHSNAEGGYGTLYWNNMWDMDIGEPTGSYYAEDGLYKRNFTNGLVVVNPNDDNSITADLGGTYRRLNNVDGTLGDPLTQVTLPIKEAAVLVPVDTTAPEAVDDLSAS
jgi:hypothetical protein